MSELPAKTCSDCKAEFPATVEYFHKSKTGKLGLMSYCKECQRARSRKSYQKDPKGHQARVAKHRAAKSEHYNGMARARTAKRRITVLEHYSKGSSPSCNCCGEKHLEFLALDHVANDGAEQRRVLGLRGNQFYAWIIKQGFPEGYQVLCHNCNVAKGLYGACPHQLEWKVPMDSDSEVMA